MDSFDPRFAALGDHVRRFWANRQCDPVTWEYGPIGDRIPGFHVLRVSPGSPGEAWIYVSIGASIDRAPRGFEYFIMSPTRDDVQVENLALVAHYQSFDAHRLTLGSVVNIGRPWTPRSQLDHFVVSLPYAFGPKLEDAGIARFVWLVPISMSESLYIHENGFEEFEELLDSTQVDVIDPRRKPIV